MKNLIPLLLNVLFFVTVGVIVIFISFLALSKKINDYNTQYSRNLKGTVTKKLIPVLSLTKGIVSKVDVNIGDEVKKGDPIIEMNNPSLESEILALKQFPNNVSAATQAKVDQQLLDSLKVVAPADGVIGDISITTGNPVDEFTKLMTIYSNTNVRLLGTFSVDQYVAMKKSSKIQAHSSRLNRDFNVKISSINPNEKKSTDTDEKKISLYFEFTNPTEAKVLLDNEDLLIRLSNQNSQSAKTPLDFFVNFWNKIAQKN